MKYIIADLDNCISQDFWRVNRINHGEKDNFLKYHDYHSLCGFDRFNNVGEIDFSSTAKIIISTARPSWYQPMTWYWLLANGIAPEMLMMRDNNDNRRTIEVKQSHADALFNRYGIFEEEIYCVYDDNCEVIKYYDSLGIKTQHTAIVDVVKYERSINAKVTA